MLYACVNSDGGMVGVTEWHIFLGSLSNCGPLILLFHQGDNGMGDYSRGRTLWPIFPIYMLFRFLGGGKEMACLGICKTEQGLRQNLLFCCPPNGMAYLGGEN